MIINVIYLKIGSCLALVLRLFRAILCIWYKEFADKTLKNRGFRIKVLKSPLEMEKDGEMCLLTLERKKCYIIIE